MRNPATAKEKETGPILILTPCHNSHEFIERRIVVPKGDEHAVKIGRAVGRFQVSPTNAIFDCKVLSRNHALIWYEDNHFYIKDTKSSNGTFINNSRLSNSGEESPPTVINSGDILQLGVEIVDSAKNVASGCIIAIVEFIYDKQDDNRFIENGNADLSAIDRLPKHCLVVPEDQMYQMQQYIQEAKFRENILSIKLSRMQEALKSAQEASATSWHAMINEDRLLSRIEVLELQLSYFSKKSPLNNETKDLVNSMCSERAKCESEMKERLRRSAEETSEARLRLREMELALMNVENENTFIMTSFQNLQKEYEVCKQDYEKVVEKCNELRQQTQLMQATHEHMLSQQNLLKQELENIPSTNEDVENVDVKSSIVSLSKYVPKFSEIIPNQITRSPELQLNFEQLDELFTGYPVKSDEEVEKLIKLEAAVLGVVSTIAGTKLQEAGLKNLDANLNESDVRNRLVNRSANSGNALSQTVAASEVNSINGLISIFPLFSIFLMVFLRLSEVISSAVVYYDSKLHGTK